MADWLSDEWAAEAGSHYASLPALAGVGGTVSLSVTGPGKREATLHWTYGQDGRATEGGGGGLESADLALLLASDDAVQVLSGAVEPSVAFMRGRLKANGDGGLLLSFLESTTDDGFDQWRRKVAALAAETAA